MIFEYILYYGVAVLYYVMLVAIIVPAFMLALWLAATISKDFIGACIAIMLVYSIPVGIYTSIDNGVEDYRLSFKRDFAPELYKKEVCPNTSFPYSIDSDITYNVVRCYPVETKIRVRAEKWYRSKWGSLMQQCQEKANPIFKHRCESAAKEYFNGMMMVDIKHSTFEQMVEAGEKRFSFYSASAQEGMRY